MTQHPTTWYLTIRKGPKVGSTYPLPDGGTVSIGRDANNQIVIDDPVVSRHHARLIWSGNSFLLEDLGSANGTWVNNVLITGSVALRAGDLIGLSQEVLLAFSDQPQTDETMYASPAHGAPAPVAVQSPSAPVSPPAAAAPSTRGTQSWLAFGLGGVIAILGVLALIVIGLAVYLLLLKPPETEDAGVQAAVPTSTPIPTATPYPTHTPYPTQVPTATPYPTYTPYPTATNRPHPTQRPADTPIPTPTALPPYTVVLGRNVTYEPWGRPTHPGGCKAPYDDESPVRRFTVEVILTNNSKRFIPDHWTPTFVSASGRPLPTCIWYYNNTAVQPDETINVTFATHLEKDDWVSALVFDELGYTLAVCLNSSGQAVPCQ